MRRDMMLEHMIAALDTWGFRGRRSNAMPPTFCGNLTSIRLATLPQGSARITAVAVVVRL